MPLDEGLSRAPRDRRGCGKASPAPHGRLHQPLFPRRAAVADPGRGDSPFAHRRASRGAAGLVGGLRPGAGGLQLPNSLGPPCRKDRSAMPSLETLGHRRESRPTWSGRSRAFIPQGPLPGSLQRRGPVSSGLPGRRASVSPTSSGKASAGRSTTSPPMRRPRGIFTSSFSGTTFSPTIGTKSSRRPCRPLWTVSCRAVISSSAGRRRLPDFLEGFHPHPSKCPACSGSRDQEIFPVMLRTIIRACTFIPDGNQRPSLTVSKKCS